MKGSAPSPSGKWIDGVDPDGSVCDAARRSLEARLTAVIHHLPLAAYHAAQDAEHIHRLRVATRRAMAALELYADWLPRKRARWVKKQLKKIRRMAGEARDLDVLAERLARVYGEKAGPAMEKIAAAREEVQPGIVRLAERFRRDDRFVRKTAKLLSQIATADRPEDAAQPTQFRAWAMERLASSTDQFFAAMPDKNSDMAALHQFRIQTKVLRYTVELLSSAFEPQLRNEHYRVIEELQEHLGKIQDHVTAAARLTTWVDDSRDTAQQELLRELTAEENAQLAKAIRPFGAWWTTERAEALRNGLKTA